jgi:hypothetical protein
MADGYKTMLIDRREIGHGSTSATTSMLQYEIDAFVPTYRFDWRKAAVESYWAL